MKLSTFLSCVAIVLLASGPGVNAFWRLLCHGTLGTARLDPVVNFGQIAPHAHNIAGASNFGMFINAEDLQASNCTSCQIVEDKSTYWTPALYFQHDNGSFELVQTTGGMTVYYFNDNVPGTYDNNTKLFVPAEPVERLTAFPPNFRMVAGNTSLRNFPYPVPDPSTSNMEPSDMTQAALAAKAIGFNCMHYYNGMLAEGSMEFHYLRNKTFLDFACAQGVRFEIEFPSCWDGVRLDSEDHKSHILYPLGIKMGDCPDGFNVRTPVMFFETIWNTFDFVNQSGEFVIANGDTEGYGYHGDFFSGWNQTFLQDAINTCVSESGQAEDCPMLTLQDDSIATNCFLDLPDELRQEDYQGPMPALPGNVAVSTGPGLAAKMEGTPVTGTSQPPAPTALPSVFSFPQQSEGAASLSATSPETSDVPSPASTTPNSSYKSPASTSPDSSSSPPAQTSYASSTSGYAATTAAPSSDGNSPLSMMTMSVYTSGGHEIHVIIYEEIVTVTDVVGPSKRHAHKHAHAHGHGLV